MEHEVVRDAERGGYCCVYCGQHVSFAALQEWIDSSPTLNRSEILAHIVKEGFGDCRRPAQ